MSLRTIRSGRSRLLSSARPEVHQSDVRLFLHAPAAETALTGNCVPGSVVGGGERDRAAPSRPGRRVRSAILVDGERQVADEGKAPMIADPPLFSKPRTQTEAPIGVTRTAVRRYRRTSQRGRDGEVV